MGASRRLANIIGTDPLKSQDGHKLPARLRSGLPARNTCDNEGNQNTCDNEGLLRFTCAATPTQPTSRSFVYRHPMNLSPPRSTLLAMVSCCAMACSPPDRPPAVVDGTVRPAVVAAPRTDSAEQVSTYIRCMVQDRDGNLWFGTTTDGVVRYNGRTLDHFNAASDLGSDWVNAIAQDAQGDLWFGTRDGVVHFDGSRFTRYTTRDGLASDRVWSLLLDRSGTLWVGTYEGVSRLTHLSGSVRFAAFPLPAPDRPDAPASDDAQRINAIVQDGNDHLWFATSCGAYRFDGSRLTRFSLADGLCDDFVQTMLADNKGALWFGTRSGGLCRYQNNTFTSVDRGTENQNVLYEEPDGTLWTVNMYTGLCRREGDQTTCYTKADGEGLRVPMCLLQDRSGRLWIGTGAGLYLQEDKGFVNVTKAALLRTPL